MNSKLEVKLLLKDSGNEGLFSDEIYKIANNTTKAAEKLYPNLKQFFNDLEGTREKYMHDLIVKNVKKNNYNETK